MSESPSSPAADQPVTSAPGAELPVAGAPPQHFLVQAPVPVLDVDGFTATILGLVVFAVASALSVFFYSDLRQDGDGWWLGVSVSGFGLGLVGLAYCLYRRSRRRAGRWDRD